MADVFTTYGHSQCVNSSATGRYEDSVKELVSYIDTHYRTLPSRDHRGLDGKSSGGFASLVLGMRNPQLFGAVASHMVTVVCMAMAYSPNLERTHGFDLPFDPETGEVDEAAHSPEPA